MQQLSEELAAFLESGLSIHVATRDAGLAPHGATAWAVTVDPDRQHLVVYVHEMESPQVLADLRANGELAVGFGRPTDDRACQLKGTFVAADPAPERVRALVERQADGFRHELEQVGIPRALTQGSSTWPCVAIRMRVRDVFVQTPGPGAGERMPA